MKSAIVIAYSIFLALFPYSSFADQGYLIVLTDGEEILAKSLTRKKDLVQYVNLDGYQGFVPLTRVIKISKVTEIKNYLKKVPSLKKFNESQICKAAIAKLMGRNPGIIKIDGKEVKTILLSYTRQDDQKKWKYKCKVEDGEIIWGVAEGRWRIHPMDSKVSYNIIGDSITITELFNDGSSTNETFLYEELGK